MAPEAGDVADFGVFCERAERLLQGFEHYDEEESELIQESVTMDLAARRLTGMATHSDRFIRERQPFRTLRKGGRKRL